MPFWTPVISFGLAAISSVHASQVRDTDEVNGSQYLGFNGTVSASVTYPSEFSEFCKDITFGPYVKSYLYVGVNPPWDTNPFFFEIYHLASENDISRFISFTDDKVYNLDFASSAYTCWNDNGRPCNWVENTVEYRPELLLDLKKATVKKTKIGEEDGYEVSGNEETYIKNETERATVNGVDVADGCYKNNVDWYNWIWNDTSTWSYTISFSNSTGKASIKTEQPGATMELTYTGERITNTTWPNVELVTTDESKPQFRYSNDSEIHFKNFSGIWRASPSEFVESPTSASTGLPTSTRGARTTGTSTGSANQPSSTGDANILVVWSPLVSLVGVFAGILL